MRIQRWPAPNDAATLVRERLQRPPEFEDVEAEQRAIDLAAIRSQHARKNSFWSKAKPLGL